MTTFDPLAVAAAFVVACTYVVKTAYELVLQSRNGKQGDHIAETAKLVAYALQSSLDAQTELLKDMKESQRDTRDAVKELVNYQRRHGQ